MDGKPKPQILALQNLAKVGVHGRTPTDDNASIPNAKILSNNTLAKLQDFLSKSNH